MAIATNKLVAGSMAIDIKYSSSKLLRYHGLSSSHKVQFSKLCAGHNFGARPSFPHDSSWPIGHCAVSRDHHPSCLATRTQREHIRHSEDCADLSSHQAEEDRTARNGSQFDDELMSGNSSTYPNQGIAEACRFVYNDAKFVNERARKDIVLLSRGLTRLNDRARQDVQFLGLEFLKLDARARKDTGKFDSDVKKKAACLNHIAAILKDKAQSDLKRAADQHWSDGALEADLRRADFLVKRRAMEDAFMALKFIRNIHDMMVNKMYQQTHTGVWLLPCQKLMGLTTLLLMRFFPHVLNLATLIDLDAMDGKSTVSLLAECASSPDVNTRQALANALATAPSMWTLGNAGMGALKRLAEDNNPAVAAAASKAIDELRRQWELQEGDHLQFRMKKISPKEVDETDAAPDNQ